MSDANRCTTTSRRELTRTEEAFGMPSSRSTPMRMLRIAEVSRMTGPGKTSIYALLAAGKFPMRVQLTDHTVVGWVEADIQAWIASRIAASSTLVRTELATIPSPSRRRPDAR
jgi:prophage regulatory protein